MTDLVRAVRVLASDLGIEVEEPEFLRSTNNTVVWLRPAPVVVKGTRRRPNRLEWEHAVASSLQRHGGPVVGPLEIYGPAVHSVCDWDMTLWPYHPQDGSEPPPDVLSEALADLHRAAGEVAEEMAVPSWDEAPRNVLSRLEDPSYASALGDDDRRLLVWALDQYVAIVAGSARVTGLHGSPHGFNVLTVDGEPRFCDLESACTGPVEWDLAHMDPEVAALYRPGFSPDALATARLVVSGLVSAVCWDGIDRGPDMRFHAEAHLAKVRATTP